MIDPFAMPIGEGGDVDLVSVHVTMRLSRESETTWLASRYPNGRLRHVARIAFDEHACWTTTPFNPLADEEECDDWRDAVYTSAKFPIPEF